MSQSAALGSGLSGCPLGRNDNTVHHGRGESGIGRCLDETLDGNLHGSSLGNVNVFADAPGSIKLATGGLPERM